MPFAAARLGDSFSDNDTVGQGSGDVMINGLPAARLGDLTTGHSCWPAVPIIEGSGSVMVNGLPLVRLGDAHAVHCDTVCTIGDDPGDDCHDGIVTSASGDVFSG